MPKFQDQFSEVALEEFISIELDLEQEHGLGTAFYNAMQSTIQALLEFPQDDACHSHFGCTPRQCDWFPINVFYRIEAEFVVVYAVAHQHRKPFYWAKRIPH